MRSTTTITAPAHGQVRMCDDEGGGNVVAIRDDTCSTLEELDTAAKGRASIVRSCTELRDISEAERESLKDLLRCITEHRKRLRAVRRLWKSLDAFERPSTELVEATQLCLREAREMAEALEPWRIHTIDQIAASVVATWARLAHAAERVGNELSRERVSSCGRPAAAPLHLSGETFPV